jgi:hypothetical protein
LPRRAGANDGAKVWRKESATEQFRKVLGDIVKGNSAEAKDWPLLRGRGGCQMGVAWQY